MSQLAPHLERSDGDLRPLYLASGRAILSWSKIEDELAQSFAKLTKTEYWTARHLFFSVSGYSSRHSLLSAALRMAKIGQDERDFFTATLKKMQGWSDFRNAIVHGVPAIELRGDGSRTPLIVEGGVQPRPQYLEEQAISVAMLERASGNFEELAWLVSLSSLVPVSGVAQPLSELELQVRQLPNDPMREESPQNRAARLQQIQADLKRRSQSRSKT